MTRRVRILLAVLGAVVIGSLWLEHAAEAVNPAVAANGVKFTRLSTDVCPGSGATCLRANSTGDLIENIDAHLRYVVAVSPSPNPATDSGKVVQWTSTSGYSLAAGGAGSVSIGNSVSGATPGDWLKIDGSGNLAQSVPPATSVSNSDGTLTVSPTTGAVVASLATGHANTWTALQTFNFGINTTSGSGLCLQQSGSCKIGIGTGDNTSYANLDPSANNAKDLGTASFAWRSLYLGTSILGTYTLGGTPTLGANLTVGSNYIGANTSASAPTSPCIAPTLLNSWVNFGAPYHNACYFKDSNGIVHLEGMLKSGTSATAVMMTLPAGYRPSATLYIPMVASGLTVTIMQIDSSGNVSVAQNGSTTYTPLNGITFLAEQ